MCTKFNIIASIGLMLAMYTIPAISCNEMDPKIQSLLEEKKYDEAEKYAMNKAEKSPGDINAQLNLGYVYYNRALTSAIRINTRAMGLADGETGSFNLEGKNIEKYFSDAINHNPVYGEKTETEFKEITKKVQGESG